jgi:thioredoxin reductase (NADPH)
MPSSVIKKAQVLVIGSGPAGYTAAIYAARSGLETLVISGPEPGGQLMWTTDVENYPGFALPIQGPFLMSEMKKQAIFCGAKFCEDVLTRVDFSKRPFQCSSAQNTYEAQTVIIATGAKAKWLGLESEEKFKGYGVSACAVCDGFFFRGKRVAVVGGGNTAVEEALYLSRHAEKVTIIHRKDQFRAEKVLQNRLFSNPKIQVIWNHVVQEVLGDENPRKVTGLTLKNTKDGTYTTLHLDGLFVAIGHQPNTELFQNWLPLNGHGYIDVSMAQASTPIPGVFVAGDVRDFIYRQAVTAAGQGCMAALEAEHFLSSIE